MSPDVDVILAIAEKGIALVALWMLYSINYNHLTSIQKTLLEILVELKKR